MPGPAPVTVVVVDDQAAVREGLALLIETLPGIAVAGQAGDGLAAVELTEKLGPDVLLMDLDMPRLGGIDATALIRQRFPETRVVVLTTYADDDSILGALRAGALGFLTKSATRDEIGHAIRAASAGQAVLDPHAHARLLAAAGQSVAADPDPDLTVRESEVLRLIAGGHSNRDIARALVVSEATVKTHVNRIFAKTGSADRAQAVRFAYRNGYTSTSDVPNP